MNTNPVKKYLDILEVNEKATPKEIWKSYKQLADIWHPDRFENKPKL